MQVKSLSSVWCHPTTWINADKNERRHAVMKHNILDMFFFINYACVCYLSKTISTWKTYFRCYYLVSISQSILPDWFIGQLHRSYCGCSWSIIVVPQGYHKLGHDENVTAIYKWNTCVINTCIEHFVYINFKPWAHDKNMMTFPWNAYLLCMYI